MEKVRGKKKLLKRMQEIIQERCDDFSQVIFGISHTGNLEEVETLKQDLIDHFHPKEVIINYMGATMGTYTGKDGMIISFFKDFLPVKETKTEQI